MCTLRNFPHITDHCIEWARDQFELLFKKLGKNCENYLLDPNGFEEEKLGGSESGAAIFDTRAMISFFKAANARTVESCVSAAYDLFHFFFRDRILDLQAQFPKDSRMKGDDGSDKGPFWGEKKRYPTAAAYKPEDESHMAFIISTTTLIAANLGVIAPRVEGGPAYNLKAETILDIAKSLREVEYIRAPVGGLDEDKKQKVEETEKPGVKELRGCFEVLRGVATKFGKTDVQDFEKDDDLNHHIAFMTSCANLRCDNYQIKRTSFHECKVIAGRIIPALATTTTAVCGLVMFELFKVRMNLGTDSYMSRNFGLAANTYTSFSQDPPRKHRNMVKVEDPSPKQLELIGKDAFDEKGRVKEEHKIKTSIRSYPNGHSCWDSIKCPGSLTVRQFADWLSSEHKLELNGWHPEIGKKFNNTPRTTQIYPPVKQLDVDVLPPLTVTPNEMVMALMKNAAIRPELQKYQKLWKDLRSLPPLTLSAEEAATAIEALAPPGVKESDINQYKEDLLDLWTGCNSAGKHVAPYTIPINAETTTLKEVLKLLETACSRLVDKKMLKEAAITHIDSRKIMTIGKTFGLLCSDLSVETNDPIEFMCDIEVDLTK